MKIWHGVDYNKRGVDQLPKCLKHYRLKERLHTLVQPNKNMPMPIVRTVKEDDREILEVVE